MKRGGTSGSWRTATRRDALERMRPQTNRCCMRNARGYYRCKCICKKEITLRGGKSSQEIQAVNLRPYFQQRLQNFKILRVHSGMQRVLEPPPTLPLINEPPSALSLSSNCLHMPSSSSLSLSISLSLPRQRRRRVAVALRQSHSAPSVWRESEASAHLLTLTALHCTRPLSRHRWQ